MGSLRSAVVYENMRLGVLVAEDIKVYSDIMEGTVLYPVGDGQLYTTVFNKNGELLTTHPFSQATQYFIDKYGYPDGIKMFVLLHVPSPDKDALIHDIERKWRERGHK